MVGKAGAAPAIHEREPDLQSGGFADSLLTLIRQWNKIRAIRESNSSFHCDRVVS